MCQSKQEEALVEERERSKEAIEAAVAEERKKFNDLMEEFKVCGG